MAWQQSDLDAIDAALARDVKKVTFADGRSREFHSPDEMLKVRREMKAELGAAKTQVIRATRGTMRRK